MSLEIGLNTGSYREPMHVQQLRWQIEMNRRADAPFVAGDAEKRIPEEDSSVQTRPGHGLVVQMSAFRARQMRQQLQM